MTGLYFNDQQQRPQKSKYFSAKADAGRIAGDVLLSAGQDLFSWIPVGLQSAGEYAEDIFRNLTGNGDIKKTMAIPDRLAETRRRFTPYKPQTQGGSELYEILKTPFTKTAQWGHEAQDYWYKLADEEEAKGNKTAPEIYKILGLTSGISGEAWPFFIGGAVKPVKETMGFGKGPGSLNSIQRATEGIIAEPESVSLVFKEIPGLKKVSPAVDGAPGPNRVHPDSNLYQIVNEEPWLLTGLKDVPAGEPAEEYGPVGSTHNGTMRFRPGVGAASDNNILPQDGFVNGISGLKRENTTHAYFNNEIVPIPFSSQPVAGKGVTLKEIRKIPGDMIKAESGNIEPGLSKTPGIPYRTQEGSPTLIPPQTGRFEFVDQTPGAGGPYDLTKENSQYSGSNAFDNIPEYAKESDKSGLSQIRKQPYIKTEADAFAKQINHYQNGKLKRDTLLTVGSTPRILELLGARQLPVVIDQSTIYKSTKGKHGLSLDTLKQLTEHIHDPIMVFDSATQPDSYVIMTELINKEGKTIIAAIHLEKSVGRLVVHDIASVYAKDNDKWFANQIEEGNLRYADKKRSRKWLMTRGLYLPKVRGAIYGSNNNITTIDGNVNDNMPPKPEK